MNSKFTIVESLPLELAPTGISNSIQSAVYTRHWRNDGVAAASRDGLPPLVRGPQTVPEFLMINLNVCVVVIE